METIKVNIYELVISVPRWDSIHELPSMDSHEAEAFFTDQLFKGKVLQETKGFTDYRFILDDHTLVAFFKNAPWPKFWEKFFAPNSEASEEFQKNLQAGNTLELMKLLSAAVDEPWTTEKAYEAVVEIKD